MAISKTQFFILLVCILSVSIIVVASVLLAIHFKASSCTLSGNENELLRGSDYDKWVSWHVGNFKNKTVLGTSAGVTIGPNGTSENKFDFKLRQAELNKKYITVNQDGICEFRTIKDAIETIPLSNTGRVIISIKPGTYREKIMIDKKKPFVTLKAADYNNPPKITWNDSSCHVAAGRTLDSATVAVNSDYFVAMNIFFENPVKHERGVNGSQAVALQISGTKGAFYNCTFTGYQDTLYDHEGLHYFKNCSIYGDVDFICGYGQSLYEGCALNSIGENNGSSITARKRNAISMSSGFSFINCTVKGTTSNMVYLGRSWGDHSRVVFSYTYMDNIALPKGWDDWSNPKNDKTIYYGEYKCSGPGSDTRGRVPWARILTDQEAEPFIGTYFVEGDTWILDPFTV